LPSELSGQGIKYAAEEAKEVASDNFLELSREIELLRSRVERVEKRA
jgi:hypothetical protein